MLASNRELKCYWLRGLPSCGKTEKALSLVVGTEGIICDPHQWFGETREQFRHYKLTSAKRWAWSRCKMAAYKGITPIIMDMHVGVNNIAIQSLKYLEQLQYKVELIESDSDYWRHIKALLLNKRLNRDDLDRWAQVLAGRSQFYKYTEIRARMNNWQFDTIDAWRF